MSAAAMNTVQRLFILVPPWEALITSGLLHTVHGLHGLTRIFGTKTLLIRKNPWIFPLSMFISPFNQCFHRKKES
jgi:hypothetical protein